MKYQLLFWSLIGISLGFDLFGDRTSYSYPAPVFQSIVEEIKTRIPSNLKIRLPGHISPVPEDITLYSFIPDDDFDFISLGEKDLDTFIVLVSETPDCEQENNPLDCTVGIIGVSETSSLENLEIDDLPDDIADLTPVKLNKHAQGFYFVQDEDYQIVVWKQDRLAHLLIAESCDDDCVLKQDLIEMATSAANEPAITSSDTSYYSF